MTDGYCNIDLDEIYSNFLDDKLSLKCGEY